MYLAFLLFQYQFVTPYTSMVVTLPEEKVTPSVSEEGGTLADAGGIQNGMYNITSDILYLQYSRCNLFLSIQQKVF